MNSTRRPAVAGTFYPSSPPALRAALAAAYAGARDVDRAAPVAIVAPHAGYMYSGPIAATAYGALRPLGGTVTRVVLLGPSHYVPFDGVAVPSVDAFATPLGDVAVLPVAVGRADDDVVAGVIGAVWDGASVVPIVSTDLSHYLSYDEAAVRDGATAAHVEGGRAAEIGPYDACGYRPLRGLMAAAGARGLSMTAVDLRSSGDTAGDRARVVGYGAFLVA